MMNDRMYVGNDKGIAYLAQEGVLSENKNVLFFQDTNRELGDYGSKFI